MMSMLMLNMQSSIQMLPLLQQKQMQQKQSSMQFQTYINQMQALNSMLHTLSYGTPLSELNKLHTGVKNQFESYNNEVSNRLKGVINKVKSMGKVTDVEKEKLITQLNDPDLKSDDEDDEEFKDELDKLEEKVEAEYKARANTNQAFSVGGALDPSESSRPVNMQPLKSAGMISQSQFYLPPPPAYPNPMQQPGFGQSSMIPGYNPYMQAPIFPSYGYEFQQDNSSLATKRNEKKDKHKKARYNSSDSSSSEPKKKKKKNRKLDLESQSKISALESPRSLEPKDKKVKLDPMSFKFPGMPSLEGMEGMDPMMKNMMLLNMMNNMTNNERKKKKKRSHKREKDEVFLV